MDAEFHLIPTLLLGDWRKAQIALRRSSSKYVLCQLVKFVHEGGCTREVLYLPSSAVVADAEQHPNPMENIAVVLKKFNTVFKKGIPGLGDEDAVYRLGFDKVIEILDSCVVLFELDEPKGEIKYQCSCYDFWHYYKCEHSLAMSITKKGVKIPEIYNLKNIGSTKKRGRPKLAKAGESLGPKGKKTAT